MKFSKKTMIAVHFGLIIICIVMVILSPRFGYKINKLWSGKEIPFVLSQTEKIDNETKVTYISADGSSVNLVYNSRFFGEFSVYIDNEFEARYAPWFMGALRVIDSVSPEHEILPSLRWYIVSSDSGAYFFLSYIKPTFFIVLSYLMFMLKTKFNNKTISIIANVCSFSLIIIAFLYSLRII